jgi:hypothetical protein
VLGNRERDRLEQPVGAEGALIGRIGNVDAAQLALAAGIGEGAHDQIARAADLDALADRIAIPEQQLDHPAADDRNPSVLLHVAPVHEPSLPQDGALDDVVTGVDPEDLERLAQPAEGHRPVGALPRTQIADGGQGQADRGHVVDGQPDGPAGHQPLGRHRGVPAVHPDLLKASSRKISNTPRSSALPTPWSSTSLNTPQKTPSAVRLVRSRWRERLIPT